MKNKNNSLIETTLRELAMSFKSTSFSAIVSLILLAAISRIIPHPYNFTPIAALALFGAANLGRGVVSFIIPLLAMLLSDALIGFHDGMAAVYGSFAAIYLLGRVLITKISFGKVFTASLLSSTLFFLITNFAVWYGGSLYPQNIQGLVASYVAGLAFYQNSFFGNLFLNNVMGDLFYNGLLFGTYAIFQKRFALAKA